MLGADAGTHSVKIVSVSRQAVEQVRLAIYPGWPSHSEDDAKALLDNLVRELGCRGQRVWGSIEGTAIIARLTSFPAMSDEELKGAVALEAEEFVSRDWSAMDFGYDVVERLADGEVKAVFVAAPRELSDRRISYFRSSGLYCDGVTVDSLALTNAFLRSATQSQKEAVVLLVNIGASTTNMVLLNAGKLTVLRDIAFGGNDINEAIVSEFSATFQDAEKMKLDSSESSVRLMECIQRALRPLLRQISRTIGYETRRRESTREVMICLSGGGSCVPGMADHITENFGFPVEFLDPFLNMESRCELPADVRLRSCYAVAIGSALMGEQMA